MNSSSGTDRIFLEAYAFHLLINCGQSFKKAFESHTSCPLLDTNFSANGHFITHIVKMGGI